MISCAEAVRRLWEYLDDELAEPERAQVEEHLSVCRRCCGEVEFAEELRKFLQAAASDELPDDVRSRLTQTLDDLEAAP
jgi:mycothiol system anti-sigma-R factor